MGRPLTIVSKSQIAKLLKLSSARVSQMIKAGMPVRPDGRVSQDEALDWYRSHIKQTAKPARAPRTETPKPNLPETADPRPDDEGAVDGAGGPAPEDYWAVRTRHERAKADLAERNLAVLEGKLLDAEETAAVWAAIGVMIRDTVMALPTRIVNRLPDEWRRTVSTIVTEETRRALSAISHEARRIDRPESPTR
jgi:phage terminase Nu1 subunit (DNA packaging protein)